MAYNWRKEIAFTPPLVSIFTVGETRDIESKEDLLYTSRVPICVMFIERNVIENKRLLGQYHHGRSSINGAWKRHATVSNERKDLRSSHRRLQCTHLCKCPILRLNAGQYSGKRTTQCTLLATAKVNPPRVQTAEEEDEVHQ